MVDELTMFPDVLYNPVNRMLPDDIRLAAVATPVLSIVVSLARSAANMAMTSAAVATPVVSIVEMRLLRFPDVL